MSKSIKLLLSVLLILILSFCFFWLIRICTGDPYYKRLTFTLTSLERLRYNIDLYKQKNGNFPNSLRELNGHIEQNKPDGYSSTASLEYISKDTGEGKESNVLDGQGGWYYNEGTGEVRVNITQPLKYYFKNDMKFYRRNKIPSEW